jgi:hypothetical protein
MKEEMTARMEARIDANSEKLEVLQSTFISRMISTKPGQRPFMKK